MTRQQKASVAAAVALAGLGVGKLENIPPEVRRQMAIRAATLARKGTLRYPEVVMEVWNGK